MGGYSQFGLTRSLDVLSRLVGNQVYLRVLSTQAENVQSDNFAQFGFQVSASGQTVESDVAINPPPIITDIPMRDIGLNSAELSFGDKKFRISHTWVRSYQQLFGWVIEGTTVPDYYRVFRDNSVVGLKYMNRLFKIISILPIQVGSGPTWWDVIGSFQEQPPIP